MQRPSENLIIPVTTDSSGKIYIREQFGYFQRLRRRLGWLLMLLFMALPWLHIDGRQALRIDVERFAIEWFGFVVLPQDFAIVALLFAIAAFALFYATKLYGRIWCGYVCPQTIWSLLFVWVERRIEGPASKSKALDAQPWRGVAGLRKLAIRLAKHSVWGLLSLATALVFVSYFVPARSLYSDFFQGNASAAVQSWVWFFALCTYLNAGLVREKMCLHMCPYARFQSSMFDRATKLVAYDSARGEARGARKKSADKPSGMGDCVDCNLCVQVCPVGIDIRHGLQYECINCGLCIDACDATMRQFGYPTGLIRYHGDHSPKGLARLSRHLGYGVALLVLLGATLLWFNQLTSTALTVSRDRQQLSRLTSDGQLENTFTLRVSNKTLAPRHYQLTLQGLAGASLLPATPSSSASSSATNSTTLELKPLEDREFVITVALADCPGQAFIPFAWQLLDTTRQETVTVTASFYGGGC